MQGAALAALLLAAEAFLQPRRPGPTTALAARKRSQRSKEKGSADHSSVDDWTGRRRRRIRDDVEAALDDPNWFGNRGEAYEAAGDDDPMAGWFDEESMVADGMGAGRARAGKVPNVENPTLIGITSKLSSQRKSATAPASTLTPRPI